MSKVIQLSSSFGAVTGQIFELAHAGSFENTNFSQPLTTYAIGYKDPTDLEAQRRFLFPDVKVNNYFQFMKADNSKDFIIEDDLTRAPGADFKRIKYSGTKVTQKVPNRGLGIVIDEDDVTGGDITGAQQSAVETLIQRINRTELDSAVTMLQSASTLTAKVWDATHDPEGDIENLIDGSGDLIGFDPNRLAFIGGSWIVRKNALRATNTPAAGAALSLTPDGVAQGCGAERGMIIRARKQSGASKVKIGSKNVIAFMAYDGMQKDDPSNTKCFWTPCQNGKKFRVLIRQVGDKSWLVLVEYYSVLVATSTLGLKGHTVANA